MIPEKLTEILRHEGVVAIATLGDAGPHLVNTWNSYVAIGDAGTLLIPAGGMHVTERNVARNAAVLVTFGSREVDGRRGPGAGFLVRGTAAFHADGPRYAALKARFPWARALLEIAVDEVTQTL
jgi:hypothetical protein